MRAGPLLTSAPFLAAFIVLASAVFLPGISGPYLFDDHENIVENSYLHLDALDPGALSSAASSGYAGPLRRPVAMVSFALNYYLAGGLTDSTPWKLTNLAIHALNALLLFWLLRLTVGTVTGTAEAAKGGWTQRRVNLLAAGVAVLWVVHPINLTSVLYLVQRMAELSALFVLLALICYVQGRLHIRAGKRRGYLLAGAGILGFGTLGVLSKENAALLPVYVAVVELFLFSADKPWRAWHGLSKATRYGLMLGAAALGVALLVAVIEYARPGYVVRDFSMSERLLTQSRVLFFYLSLMIVPRIQAFGLHHDDIAVSTSWLSPWTTLPSVAGIAGLLALAWWSRRRYPLVSLGLVWFFASHLLESTVLPLEIAHEHRNYLASAGALLSVVAFVEHGVRKVGPRAWALYGLLALLFAGTTALRASQWSDFGTFVQYEARHHPNSARALGAFSAWLDAGGRHRESLEVLRRIVELDPDETAWWVDMHIVAAHIGEDLTPAEQARTLDQLISRPHSASTLRALGRIGDCVQNNCPGLQEPLKSWSQAVIDRSLETTDLSFFYYLLGRVHVAQGNVLDALNAFQRSSELDTAYLHPLFEMANLFVQLRQVDNAVLILQWLREANGRAKYRRDREIAQLQRVVDDLRAVSADSPSKP